MDFFLQRKNLYRLGFSSQDRHLEVTPWESNWRTFKVPQDFKMDPSKFLLACLRAFVQNYVQECEVCQQMKQENFAPAGMLHQLPIPSKNWIDITIGSIEELPQNSRVWCSDGGGWSVVEVCTFSSSLPSLHCCDCGSFISNQVVKLNGMPLPIVCDRDPAFISLFWWELFKLQGTHLKHSSVYHTQIDGLSEVVNKCLETHFQCFTCNNLDSMISNIQIVATISIIFITIICQITIRVMHQGPSRII